MTSTETRADRFVRDMAELKIPDPAAGRSGLWLRLGGALMVLGPVLALAAYLLSHGTRDPLVQNDAITLIKLKEVYEFFENTIDRFEDVADMLQGVVVKNS